MSEELHRAVARNLPESSVLVLDGDGRILVAQGPLMDRLGFSRTDLEGRMACGAFGEPLGQVLEEGRRRVLDGVQSKHEVEHRGLNLEVRHVPLRDENGRTDCVMVFLSDTTERVRAEEDLKRAKDELEKKVSERTSALQETHHTLVKQSHYLEAFFRYAATPLVFLDGDFNFIRANEAYARACGRSVEEFPGRNHFELFPSDARSIFEEVVRTKRPYQTAARPFRYPDHPERGETYWDWTLTPVLEERGEVEFLVLALEDVTERILTERELSRHREQLEQIVRDRTRELESVNARLEEEIAVRAKAERALRDTHDRAVWLARFPEENPNPVIRVSFDGEILYRNSAASDLCGYACEVGGKLPVPFREFVECAVEQGREIDHDVSLGSREYSVSIVPFSVERYANIYGRDVTERVLSQKKVRRQNKIQDTINQIFHKAFECETEEELGGMILSVLEELTGSAMSFIGEIGPDGFLHDVAISDAALEKCALRDEEGHRRPPGNFELRGLFGRVLREGRSLLTNDPATHPDSIGTPDGHPTLIAFLGVPFVKDRKTIGMVAVANRAGGYTPEQQHDLETVTPAVFQVLLRKKAEEALRSAKEELEKRVRERTAELSRANEGLAAENVDRRKAEETVREERRRLIEVLDNLPVYVALLTPDHHMPFANRFFKERFGESKGRRCFEFLFRRDEPCEQCYSYKVLETGRPHHWDWVGPDGRNYEISDFPFTDVDGTPLVMEVGSDVTERKRAEADLAATMSSLRDEVKQRRFAEGHLQALNEQLNARVGQVKSLIRKLTQVERSERRRIAKLLHDHLQQLLVSAKVRLAILGREAEAPVKDVAREIEKLLDESISASQTLTAELSPPILHIGNLKDCMEWLIRFMSGKYGLEVAFDVEGDVPTVSDDLKAFLFESVRELLFNSFKHARVGSAALALRRTGPGALQITVSDKGCGFDPASLKPYEKIDGGFGLISLRERLELIDGTLSIESCTGTGSRFVLNVPFSAVGTAEQAHPAPVRDPAQSVRAGAPAPGPKLRVMLVDDHAVVREGLARLLGQEPDIDIVGEASDGQEAVELAEAVRPDVILMDKNMPRLDGLEATRILHRRFPDIHIIGLSMLEETENAEAMKDAGAVTYLIKTGPIDEVVAAIRAARSGLPPQAPVSHGRSKGGSRRGKGRK